MTTYLSRPVWPFATNWANSPSRQWTYDVREKLHGFGLSDLSPLQAHPMRAWQFSMTLKSAAEIAAWDAFCDAAKGRLNGFWFADHARIGTVVAAASGTSVDVVEFDLASTWDDDPCVHLVFTDPDGETYGVEVTAVTEDGDVDRLTLDPALPSTPTTGWTVHRLLYVRLADDVNRGTIIDEGVQDVTVKVLELPTEYVTAVTGDQPVFLYRFFRVIEGTETSWRFTSFADEIVSNGETFAPENLTHGTIRRAVTTDQESVEVSAMWDASLPWASGFPDAGPWPLWVEISQVQAGALDTVTVLFTGRESGSAKVSGRNVSMTFASWLDSLDSRLPHILFGPRCPFALYDLTTCGVDRTSYQVDATIAFVWYQAVRVAVASTYAAGYFTGGTIRFGSGASTVILSILASTEEAGGEVVLTLNARPPAAAAVDDAVAMWPGCDKTNGAGGCAKFSNIRFGGTPFVPRTNLTIKPVEVAGAGGKK